MDFKDTVSWRVNFALGHAGGAVECGKNLRETGVGEDDCAAFVRDCDGDREKRKKRCNQLHRLALGRCTVHGHSLSIPESSIFGSESDCQGVPLAKQTLKIHTLSSKSAHRQN